MNNNTFIILCISLCLLFTIDTSAQERNNKRFVGGNVAFQLTGATQSNNRLISYSIAPVFGTFVSDKIVAGAGVGYQGTYSRSNLFGGGFQEEQTSFLFINPFVRFRKPVGEKLGFYTELDFLVGGEFGKTGVGNNAIAADPAIRTGFHVGPGMDYRFADRWFFTVKWGILGFDTYKVIGAEQLEYSLGFNFDMSHLMLGINFYL